MLFKGNSLARFHKSAVHVKEPDSTSTERRTQNRDESIKTCHFLLAAQAKYLECRQELCAYGWEPQRARYRPLPCCVPVADANHPRLPRTTKSDQFADSHLGVYRLDQSDVGRSRCLGGQQVHNGQLSIVVGPGRELEHAGPQPSARQHTQASKAREVHGAEFRKRRDEPRAEQSCLERKTDWHE